ncbi:protein CMSS1-like isoform X2 [Chenopodium quinoa]|uniref:protein CMSS1-like isoform X2 n=1 Tax=Chenopodium quinoa TaxID=63459 RepID=UPI000B793190|nr:protein CMSS1-like isoform X2 [Chenopodium quinoa]
MATGKAVRGKNKPSKFGKNKPSKFGNNRPKSLAPKKPKTKNPKKNKKLLKDKPTIEKEIKVDKPIKKAVVTSQILPPSERRKFFVDQFESASGIKLSSLELESIKDTYFPKPLERISQDAGNLGEHIKGVFGSSWKEVLCESQLVEGKVDPGNPAVLVISASAIKSLEMLRGLRILTKECQAVKLFSKHLKIDEQVTQLKNRVNIASGTPSRDEFWDLYKSYFHQRLLQGSLRVCLYGPIPVEVGQSAKKSEDEQASHF